MHSAFSKKDLNSTFWFTSEKIIHFIFSILIIPKIFNTIGTIDMGRLKFVEASLGMFTPIFFLGLSTICIREMVTNPKLKEKIISSALIMRLISWFVMGVGLILYAYFSAQHALSTIYFIILLSYLFRITDVFEWYFIVSKQAKYIFLCKTISLLIIFSLQYYGLKHQFGVIFYAFTLALDYLCQGLLYYYFLKSNRGSFINKWHPSFTLGKKLIKEAFPLILSNALVMVYIGIDEMFLKYYLNDHAVGIFGSVQFLVIGLSWTIGFAIINALYPSLAESYHKNKNTYYKKFRQLNAMLIILGIGIGLFYTFYGNIILNTCFTRQYTEANTPLRIFCWAPLFVFFGMLYEKHLLTISALNHEVYRFALGCILNVILCYILIPIYQINGAALAVLISHFTINVIYPLTHQILKPVPKLIFNKS
ncbi:flippase [Formosa haliotis]|uniref:flippase n=1 Tax=Formosa haliotis TaxID=1555194 RepID=UPI000826DDFC|nr:flippase [Formosa haliotis]